MLRVVVAIGGNSIITSPDRVTIADQYRAISETCAHLTGLVLGGAQLLITHGNGPQVGFGLQRSELARSVVHEVPLDAIDADTQGSLGYLIQQAMGNALRQAGADDRVAAVVTQVVVDSQDPGFRAPTKPVGRFYTELEAQAKIAELGWNMVLQPRRGWRRVVPSPRPLRIVETWAMQRLLDDGAVVVGCGGGGIPVVERHGELHGVQAVIDKDRASALLARQVGADMLIFSTGIEQAFVDYGGPNERPLGSISAAEAERYLEAGEFPAGSMGPKVEGAIEFVRAGGRVAIITDPPHLPQALHERGGTRITLDGEPEARDRA